VTWNEAVLTYLGHHFGICLQWLSKAKCWRLNCDGWWSHSWTIVAMFIFGENKRTIDQKTSLQVTYFVFFNIQLNFQNLYLISLTCSNFAYSSHHSRGMYLIVGWVSYSLLIKVGLLCGQPSCHIYPSLQSYLNLYYQSFLFSVLKRWYFSMTNSPDIITVILGSLITKFYVLYTYFLTGSFIDTNVKHFIQF